MKLSVVIPCHNADPYLAQTIGAVLDQSRRPDEVIVVDDGSTDGSLTLAQRFESTLPELIRVVGARFRRATRARNLGARLATGDALMFLDADDVLRPDALEALSAALAADLSGIALCPWFRVGYVDGRWISQPPSCAPRRRGEDALSAWLTGWYHPPCSVLWSRAAFERAGRWDEQSVVNQDGDLMMRALAYGTPLLDTSEGAAYYRRPARGLSSLSGTRSTPRGLRARVRTIRKIAWLLEDQDRLPPYQSAISAAFARVAADAADAADVGEVRREALALARQYRPSLWTRIARPVLDSPPGAAALGPPPVRPGEIRYGIDRAEQVLREAPARPARAREVRGLAEGPIVSVVIPTYNRGTLLRRAITSVLAQTFTDFEILVVDDGSTDDTAQIVGGLTDERIRYLRQSQNRGVAAARNRGLRDSRGELIAFLDSDDEWLPEKLGRQVELFRHAPDHVALTYTGVERIYPDGSRQVDRPQARGDVYRAMLERNIVHGGGSNVMIRRDVVATAGFFHEGMPAIEDYEYWLRISRFFRVDAVDDPLIRYYDPQVPGRRSRAFRDNLDARWWFYRRHRAEMRQAGMAHLYLLKTARWVLQQPQPDVAAARRLAMEAVREKPYSRLALSMLVRTLVRRGRMRVLLYSTVQPDHRGGVQAVIGRIARHLRRRGHHVVKAWATPGGKTEDALYRPPHLVWKGAFPTPRSVAGACLDVLRLALGLARHRPHIVNIHFATRDALLFYLLRPVFRYKVVISVHGSDVLRPKPANAGALPAVLGRADAITVVSQPTAARVTELEPLVAGRMHLISNGVDCAFWRSTGTMRPLAERGPVVLAVGRLHPVKGHDVLLQAFKKVAADVPGARLVIVGAGGFRPELEGIADALALGPAIEFAGELEPEGVRQRMAEARVFVLPSRSEGLPLTLLEAMAARLPVVATNVGGVPEVVTGGAGSLVAPEDAEALADAVSHLLLNADAAAAMAALASQRAAHFAAAAADAAYEDLFQRLLRRPAAARGAIVQSRQQQPGVQQIGR